MTRRDVQFGLNTFGDVTVDAAGAPVQNPYFRQSGFNSLGFEL